ncbi:hypothetical protein [Okeania sp. SIO1I7]|uniref:hypothetical protein n=1 Tax=Okeania sp. SIO1I7 TaxID=2607772 RepID=UPI0013FC163F|nr:hypothetical protein [Okeania sp. SIO1I7]NET23981.1 hypothetical protein [Okeania sp. SIO1I7]
MEPPQCIFDPPQNEIILDLSNKMRFVSYVLIGAGVISGIIGLFSSAPEAIIEAVIQILIGVWTLNAASSFKLIVDTQGNSQRNDIVNLMGALGELRKLYGLLYWLLIISLISLAIMFFASTSEIWDYIPY